MFIIAVAFAGFVVVCACCGGAYVSCVFFVLNLIFLEWVYCCFWCLSCIWFIDALVEFN